MKRAFMLVAAVIVTASCPTAMADGLGRITVHVSTFRSVKGSLRCRLYSRGDGFPGKPPYDAEEAAAVTGTTGTCIFSGIAPGTYAVALFHDENGNGKLDTNFLGIPREGVGVSNNKLRTLGPPTWEDSKFVLAGSLTFDVTLHY